MQLWSFLVSCCGKNRKKSPSGFFLWWTLSSYCIMGYDVESQGHNKFYWLCNAKACVPQFIRPSQTLPMVNPKHPLHCRGMGSRSQQAQMTTENTCLLLNCFTQTLSNLPSFFLRNNPNNHNILREGGQRSRSQQTQMKLKSTCLLLSLLTFPIRSSLDLSFVAQGDHNTSVVWD